MAEIKVRDEETNYKILQKDEAAGEMKPWEQHSSVISIPRYDYKAPPSFLIRSFSGFLVTCPINVCNLTGYPVTVSEPFPWSPPGCLPSNVRTCELCHLGDEREKSATKEVMTILDKYLGSISPSGFEEQDNLLNVVAKRRKLVVSETEECINDIENRGAPEVSEGSCLSSSMSEENTGNSDPVSLVKLTKSGLLLITFPGDHCPKVVNIVSNIMQSLESGSLKAPLWCHRILPIQTTCVLHENELCTLVSKLIADFMNNEGKELARPIKFAVGYNSRGIKETEIKGEKNDLNSVAILDRSKCFEVVAAAVKTVVSDSVVDLTCPELTVLIELLPISGLPKGSPVAAVSVLPRKLIMTKPRLCIKALVLDTKSKS